jgi:hypothetical protein
VLASPSLGALQELHERLDLGHRQLRQWGVELGKMMAKNIASAREWKYCGLNGSTAGPSTEDLLRIAIATHTNGQ